LRHHPVQISFPIFIGTGPIRGFATTRAAVSAAIGALPGLRVLSRSNSSIPLSAKALLASPHRRPADADALRHLLRRVAICRGEDNLRPLDVFARPVWVGRDCRQLLAFGSAQYHAYLRCHDPSPECHGPALHIPMAL